MKATSTRRSQLLRRGDEMGGGGGGEKEGGGKVQRNEQGSVRNQGNHGQLTNSVRWLQTAPR